MSHAGLVFLVVPAVGCRSGGHSRFRSGMLSVSPFTTEDKCRSPNDHQYSRTLQSLPGSSQAINQALSQHLEGKKKKKLASFASRVHAIKLCTHLLRTFRLPSHLSQALRGFWVASASVTPSSSFLENQGPATTNSTGCSA